MIGLFVLIASMHIVFLYVCVAALRLYEQQLALLSNMSQASPATAAMFPYNPYLLGSMAGLTGYAGLPGAAAAVPGLAEYQAALAAAMTSQFPPAGEHLLLCVSTLCHHPCCTRSRRCCVVLN